MANEFKQYKRNRRQTTIEQDFSKGMQFNNGTVDFSYAKMLVNYNTYNDKSTLVPRAGLQLSELVLPTLDVEELYKPTTDPYYSVDVSIKDAKECVEADGNTYKQFILGSADVSKEKGKVYVLTAPVATTKLSSEHLEDFELDLSLMQKDIISSDASYLVTELNEIHGIPLKDDSKVSALIGSFAFGNNYYFIHPVDKTLCKTYFSEERKIYEIEALTPKSIDPSEAVTYGYNMLLGEAAYDFKNSNYEGSVIQLTGILPYDVEDSKTLLMTPKKNQEILFKCFCKAPVGVSYKFVWEWRTVSDGEWAPIAEETYEAVTEDTIISVAFKPPSTDIMIRVQAYKAADTENVEKAMTVGFDFSIDKENNNIDPSIYDLFTATGITYWKNRLVMWGVKKDPTILFLSDLNEPTYFPYPNNISVFNEPIVSVKAYMDTLLVFTTSQVHQVAMNEDGTTWNTTLLQSNLYIRPWDQHLIQVVRNMVFFKSGNYYYMIVPKAQSTTGELTLAPVSTPIVEFFNRFERHVAELLKDVFDYEDIFDIVHYYNFLDYEDVHNVYVIDYEDDRENYLHLDVIYNTVNRSWKIHTFDAPHFLYPYKNDATQTGTLAATSLIKVQPNTDPNKPHLQIESAKRFMFGLSNILYIEPLNLDYFYNADYIEVYYRGSLGFRIKFEKDLISSDADKFVLKSGNYCLEIPVNATAVDKAKLYALDGVPQFFFHEYITIQYTQDKSDEIITEDLEVVSGVDGLVLYPFKEGSIQLGSCIEFYNNAFILDSIEEGWMYNAQHKDLFKVRLIGSNYFFMFGIDFKSIELAPVVSTYKPDEEFETLTGRCIQLYKFNNENVKDIFLPADSKLACDISLLEEGVFNYANGSLIYTIMQVLDNIDNYIRFKNWQFIDTGYRDDNLQLNKRYRELQLQINNIEGSNLEFSMEFNIDGQARNTYYKYEVEHTLDIDSPDYGLLSIQAVPFSNVFVPNETTLAKFTDQTVDELNVWRLDQSRLPDVSIWRVRSHISGKGQAPRLRLLSKNTSRFELMGINWVYRIMNMR